MRIALVIAGVVLILVGAVWIGQGTGYFPYPTSSFMINDRAWAYAGAASLLLGWSPWGASNDCCQKLVDH
jgi:hypothetical protein